MRTATARRTNTPTTPAIFGSVLLLALLGEMACGVPQTAALDTDCSGKCEQTVTWQPPVCGTPSAALSSDLPSICDHVAVERDWSCAADLAEIPPVAFAPHLVGARCRVDLATPVEQLACWLVQDDRLTFGSFKGKLSKKSRVPSVEIAYAKFEHPQERAAIVLVTGRTESYLKYAELIRDIVERNADLGYSLYILDHRGQGFSTRLLPDEPQKGYVEDFDNYVADLDTFLRTVVHPERHRRVFALAHSLGGGITARYLQDYQPTTDAFDAAILTSPMLGIAAVDGKERNLVGRAVEGASLALARGLVALGRGTWYLTDRDYDPDWGVWSCSAADGAPRRCDEGEGEGNSLTHSLTRHEMHRWLRLYEPRIQLGGATARWLVESYAATQTMRDAGRSSGIEIPVLVLQAELESIVSNPDQRAVCAAMPNCRLEVVPRASHEPIFEVDEIRSLYLNRLVTFFEAHLDG
ncbi:MAG: alpha/beta fold hydrolase [Deltaproteobacteria bacterium]|nr:alpha/beta fold hydrolase [Deltaproteobacteria bacterium]